jgi:hypothetical protein
MMDVRTMLEREFGGSWDGGRREIHGLVVDRERKLKVELLYSRARKIWNCTLFHGGACVGQASREDPVDAVRNALGC